MRTLLRNIRLRYKFWLLNGVAFLIVSMLVIAAIDFHHRQMLEVSAERNQEQLDNVHALVAGMSESERALALAKLPRFFIYDVRADTLSHQSSGLPGSLISDLRDSDLAEPQKHYLSDNGIFSTHHRVFVHTRPLSRGLLLGRLDHHDSLLLSFLDQAPFYALVVFALMLIQLGCSQLLINFFENHLNTLKRVMVHVRENRDLSARVEIDCKDEVGQMSAAFNTLQEGYQELMQEISETADSLTDVAQGLSGGARRTEADMSNQRKEIRRIVDTMQDMRRIAHETAESASAMERESAEASEKTASGDTAVQNSSNTISMLSSEISHASRLIEALKEATSRIDGSTQEIQTISEQTNLLALNAAIEAARAGESGRGFAVVADEVRSLAQNAHESSEGIQEVVDSIRQTVDDIDRVMAKGIDIAETSVEEAKVVTDLFSEIRQLAQNIEQGNSSVSAAAGDQSVRSDEVNEMLVVIDERTDAATESARAVLENSESMQSLADRLHEHVQRVTI